jgi:TolA-binding protein
VGLDLVSRRPGIGTDVTVPKNSENLGRPKSRHDTAAREQHLQDKLKKSLVELGVAKQQEYLTQEQRNKELARIGRKIRHCRSKLEDYESTQTQQRQRQRQLYQRQRQQRQKQKQKQQQTMSSTNNGLVAYGNGDDTVSRQDDGLPGDPHAWMQLLSANPNVTIAMPGSNVTNTNTHTHTTVNGNNYSGNHTGDNVMGAYHVPEELKSYLESTIDRMFRQQENATDRERDEISRRLVEVLDRDRHANPTDANPTDANPTDGAERVDTNLVRHKELLERLNTVVATMESQTEQLRPDGPFMEEIRSSMKTQASMRRNQDDNGENLASRFEDATSLAPEQSGTSTSLAPNAEERNRIVRETLFGGRKVQEIIQSLELDIDSYLGAGVIDHFENILVLLRDLKTGEVELPHVNTQGLHALVDQHPNAKLVDVMGDVMYLHEQCFVSVAYNDTGDFSEDGDQVRGQVLGEQRFPFTVQTELQLFYNDDDDAEAIVSV